MAIRKKLLGYIRAKEIKGYSHDRIINFYACYFNGLYFLDKVLTKRRNYDESVSNSRIQKERKNFSNIQLQSISNAMKYLDYSIYKINDESIKNKMDKYIENYKYRKNYIESKDIKSWLVNVKNIRYYESYKKYIKDFIYLFK